MDKTEIFEKIDKLIIKYGSFATILEDGCNSVFRIDKSITNISIVKYFIENIKSILQDKYKDENMIYYSIKEFIDNFIYYIDTRKKNSIPFMKCKITFNAHTDNETFIKYYPSDKFDEYKQKFVQKFNDF